MNGFRNEIAATPDGARLAYRARPGRDPWVLLHGLGCDASMWDAVVEALPSDVGLVIPEIRGHGGSSLGWRAPSVDLWAEDVELIVRSENLRAPGIAGLSMGGYTAFAFAVAFPHLARAYAFVSTSAGADDGEGRMRRAKGLGTLHTSGWRAFAAGLMPKLLNESGSDFPRHRDHLTSMFDRARETGLASALWALAARPDRIAALPMIHTPATVVAGAEDTLIPVEASERIAGALPDARLTVIPGAAHMSAMEAPKAVAGALLEVGA